MLLLEDARHTGVLVDLENKCKSCMHFSNVDAYSINFDVLPVGMYCNKSNRQLHEEEINIPHSCFFPDFWQTEFASFLEASGTKISEAYDEFLRFLNKNG